MIDSNGLTYTTRKNGEVEILRDGSVARMLRGQEAEDFLGQVKSGNANSVMAKFVDQQSNAGDSGAAQTTGTDTHPAMEDRLDGPVPHGDGEPRETDGEETPTS